MSSFYLTYPRRAFTLVELMVSIFLMLLIMVGVNTVFTTTSATIGANTAMSTANRDARAIQNVLQKDFNSVASDGAFINLRSEQLWMHLNRQDYSSDPTPTVPSSADLTGSGTESTPTSVSPTPTMPAVFYNFRSHRLDRLSFFTRQLQQRQTGNDGTFIARQATLEQWVWLGHLRQPSDKAWASLVDTDYQNPGANSPNSLDPTDPYYYVPLNPNNQFAQQWMLGRTAVGLVEPTPPAVGTAPGSIYDNASVAQDYFFRPTGLGSTSTSLAPLATSSNSTKVASVPATTYEIQESRYDLAGTSIAGYSQILTQAIANGVGSWWVDLMGGPTSRFRARPFAVRPMTSFAASQTQPILAPNCSQFMVEFAGDFVKQNVDPADITPGGTGNAAGIYGAVQDCYFRPDTNALKPEGQDGVIDFVVTNPGTANAKRSIRWYGMPRSTTGNVTVSLANGDTCPLRDTIRQATDTTYGSYSTANAPIEKTGGSGGNNMLTAAPAANYATAMTGLTGYFYQCAWGPADTVRPKLIRIVITLEDPNGRLAEGQTYEYVFSMGN